MRWIIVKNTVIACVLAAFLGWRAIASVIDLAAEVEGRGIDEIRAAFHLDEDQRIARELARWEAGGGLPTGREFVLFQALRAHVPDDGMVFMIIGEQSPKRFRTLTHMNVLLYPRWFFPVAALPPNWLAAAADMGSRCFLVEYDGARAEGLEQWCDRRTSGADFVLWQYRGAR